MIKHGLVDVVVLAFGEPRFDGSIFMELERQSASATIRVLEAQVSNLSGEIERPTRLLTENKV